MSVGFLQPIPSTFARIRCAILRAEGRILHHLHQRDTPCR